MALSRDRILVLGTTPHPHEEDAIRFIIDALPDNEPYSLWALCQLSDSSGRWYELDALILGYHALYLVEVKSHPGTVTGDLVDWTFRFPEGREIVRENPLRVTEHKARVLKSLLQREMRREPPWVEAMVLLSDPNIQVKLDGQAGAKVVTRANFARAITHGELPYVPAARMRKPVDKPTARAVRDALKAMGLRTSATKFRIGDLELANLLLEEGPGYQDRLAEHPHMKGLERRVRCYVVPPSGTDERRAQLRRAAEREASVLLAVGDHPHILSCHDYRESGPLGGPCVVLDHLFNALPLDVLLRKCPDLPFDARVEIVRQVGEALAYCHRKGIIHRNLHPGCVLVQLDAEDRPDTRLYGFQLADDPSGGLGTSQMTAFTTQQAELYRAPELFENPTAAKPASDLFSLGALAWHVFTGRSPGTTLAEREALLQNRHLSLAAASDALAAGPLRDGVASLEQVVADATDVNPVTRADDAQTWIELLLEAATRPEEHKTVDPLDAKKDDRLDGDIVVEGVLGMGATARVLLVRRGGRSFALKVPLSSEQEERLRAEHETLAELRSEKIVRTEGLEVLGKRTCLLTTYGGRTLADLLRQDGPPSLDYARRWGEDLLAALEDLEDAGIQHRDVKPANLGVMPGASKKARHLTLLDFSLATAPVTAVTVGTPVYRDPFLLARGRWDHAADRWAAAITLHELLTGVRPRWGDGDMPATAAEGPALIEAERFDPAVRDRLAAFFAKALARDVAGRHQSAEEMRTEWVVCFAAKPAAVEEEGEEGEGPAAEQIAAVRPETSVEALPLSPAARSALDRAGVVAVRELLDMPANQLSALRGVGRQTAQEILAFRDVWRETHEAVAPEGVWQVTTVHFDNVEVDQVPGLPRAAAIALEDAGLSRVGDVATAPRRRVERLLATHEGAAEALRWHLDAPTTTPAGATPATVEGWIDKLLVPPARKGRETWRMHVRLLLGVEHLDGRRVTEARELARALKVTPQLIYISLGKAREAWKQYPGIAKLHEAVVATLDTLGGIAPLTRVAEAVLAHIPHRGGDDPAAAAAIVRIAAETTSALHLGRVNDVHWLGRSEAHLLAARNLGHRADELAARTPLPSSGETREALVAAARDTPLDGLPAERLVALAAEASRTARPSARLELYQRGLPAARAIKLVAAALPAEVGRDAVVDMVRRRYPDAEPLPEHRDLDPLMAEVGLDWDETRRCYRRHGAFPTTSSGTDQIRTIVAPRQGARALTTEDEQQRSEFETRIRLALEQRALRVLEVNANYADRLIERLRKRFQLTPRSIEGELLAALQRRMTEDGVEPAIVYEADRRGPGGEDWRPLAALAAAASDDMLRDLRTAREPVLLTRPGLLARYGLSDFLKGILDAAQADDFPALFLVVPAAEGQGAAPIDGGPDAAPLPVPLTVPAQRLRVPRAWLEAPQ